MMPSRDFFCPLRRLIGCRDSDRCLPCISSPNLLTKGIGIYTTIDNVLYDIDTMDQNIGQLFMSIGIMIGAHAESRNKARRIKEVHAANRSKPSNVCPAWIRQNPATATGYEVIPKCQTRIDPIFRLCIEGWGLDRIAAHLNKTGIAAFASRKRCADGATRSGRQIHREDG
jgi:hypothetical protein